MKVLIECLRDSCISFITGMTKFNLIFVQQCAIQWAEINYNFDKQFDISIQGYIKTLFFKFSIIIKFQFKHVTVTMLSPNGTEIRMGRNFPPPSCRKKGRRLLRTGRSPVPRLVQNFVFSQLLNFSSNLSKKENIRVFSELLKSLEIHRIRSI